MNTAEYLGHRHQGNDMRKITQGLVLGALFVVAAIVSVNAQQDPKRDEVRRERMNKMDKVRTSRSRGSAAYKSR